MAFDPRACKTFRFLEAAFDEPTCTARLSYALDDGYYFTEEFTFTGARLPHDPGSRKAFEAALALLHLAAGVSYYKAALPPRIEMQHPLPARLSVFFQRLYTAGLAEFAYRNSLSLKGRIIFPSDAGAALEPRPAALPRITAVPLGGGKDSIVTLEALSAAAEPLVPVAIGSYAPIAAVAARSGRPLERIERRLDPQLFELNRQGAYNGHVPISAIIAFAVAAGAFAYGYDTIAISQERSANAENLEIDGERINHQYSKSFEFERELSGVLAAVFPQLSYFSLLRPLSELGICQIFARRCSRYLDVFTSCNKAFRIADAGGQPLRRWCCDCPKCRFVFLALAPFAARAELAAIFGRDLLDDESQIPGYAELLGLEGHKPFECVGEIEESRAALALAAAQPGWAGAAVIRHFAERCRQTLPEWRTLAERVLAPAAEHAVPLRYLEMLNAF